MTHEEEWLLMILGTYKEPASLDDLMQDTGWNESEILQRLSALREMGYVDTDVPDSNWPLVA